VGWFCSCGDPGVIQLLSWLEGSWGKPGANFGFPVLITQNWSEHDIDDTFETVINDMFDNNIIIIYYTDHYV
jgi:hypothetical protein